MEDPPGFFSRASRRAFFFGCWLGLAICAALWWAEIVP